MSWPSSIDAIVARDKKVSDLWRQAADGEISFERAAELIHSVEHSAVETSPKHGSQVAAKKRVAAADPGRTERLAARKRLAAGAMPPDLAAHLTVSEQAVGAVVARHCRMAGSACTLAIETIAELSFVSIRTAQMAVNKLDALNLIACLRRPRRGRKHDTNQLVIKSVAWRQFLWKRAAIARLDRVQKPAPEKDNTYPLYFTEKRRLGGKKALCAASHRPSDLETWISPQSEAWLAPFRKAAGDCLNPASVGLHDPGPLTRLLNRGFTEEDLFAGIAAVRRRHDRSGRASTIWSWDYFQPAITEARDKRTRLASGGDTGTISKAPGHATTAGDPRKGGAQLRDR
ncbi:hypothetical protein [Bauldia litoralis]|uniref:Helix-turn-helix domain-containing protein n=1 Tax=Bauldia litoralis TaxID=665467 RepID=A0A1G6ENK7_9HYPH|nr:hypothetical protein [Bauldia litoralis]SDB59038.1 hypothetical protein SAMN02982931_04761 [Bauldia litoralis]